MTGGTQCCLASLLVVDDESSIRKSLSAVLAEIGYKVRTAEDGFSALREIRKEVPDILLSDLHMPGMSGFELLSVVRRRFPAIQSIAMSGAFSGDGVPPGVAADGFYQKGNGLGSLLGLMATLPKPDRMPLKPPSAPTPILAPIWIQPGGTTMQEMRGTAAEATVTIACPECLRTFSKSLGGSISDLRETDCIHCSSSIHFTIVEPVPQSFVQSEDQAPVQVPQYSF
jgi:CheY-like chemotaxis protein